MNIVVTTYINHNKLNIYNHTLDSLKNLQDQENIQLTLVVSNYNNEYIPEYTTEIFDNILTLAENNLSSARNHGFCNTSEDYIFFLDDDDVIKPNFYKLVSKALKNNHNRIYPNFEVIHPNEGVTYKAIDYRSFKNNQLRAVGYKNKMFIFKVEWVLKNNLFYNESKTCFEDLDLAYRMYSKDKGIGFIEQPCYEYHIFRKDHMHVQGEYEASDRAHLDFFNENKYKVTHVYN